MSLIINSRPLPNIPWQEKPENYSVGYVAL
jgi:hypothetical protein